MRDTFSSTQMSLGQLIRSLERLIKINPNKSNNFDFGKEKVRFDFGYMHPVRLVSWRGAYEELAIEYSDEGDTPNVETLLSMCRGANGSVFDGYKGGEYVMSESTPIWIAKAHESGNTALIDVEWHDYIVVLHTEWCQY